MIKPIIFGATGMIGQAVVQECIKTPEIEKILLINRRPGQINHPKVKEIIHTDFTDFSSLINQFSEYNACFFCLGISAIGLSEEEYYKTTYEITIKAAEAIKNTGKEFTFCYISGAGTDSSEKGSMMWARVKGKVENKLLSMFEKAYMFRPGYIQPLKGIKSRTKFYNLFYILFKPFYFMLKSFKSIVTDTSSFGKAMIKVAAEGYSKRIIESKDINRLGNA